VYVRSATDVSTASATIEVEVLFPMTRRLTCRRLALVVAVAAVLAGCRAGGADGPAPPTPVPTRAAPSPTLSPSTTLVSARPRFVRVVDGYDVFAVNAQQYELVGKRIFQVLRREGLWDQGVRLGVNSYPEKGEYLVLVKPGFSGLSTRQILNRLLGIY